MLLGWWDGGHANMPLSPPHLPPLGWFSGYQVVRSQDKAQSCDTFREQVDLADMQTNVALLQRGAFAASVASSL